MPARRWGLAANELGRARDYGLGVEKQPLLFGSDARERRRCAIGGRPVVRDVVEGRPAGDAGKGCRARIVHPEQRVRHPGRIGGADDRVCQTVVRALVESTGQALHRTEPHQATLETGDFGHRDAPAGATP